MPSTQHGRQRLLHVLLAVALNLFPKYAQQYQFDYLMLAAQGYQESRLDQAAISRVGAIGIMQVMPATGTEMRVGTSDV